LHVYSKPIDSCVLFDETTRCCERRRLQYYSADGTVLSTAPQLIPRPSLQPVQRLTETAA
jgi:hypothetical protein